MKVVFTLPNHDEGIVLREYKHAGNRQPGTPYTLAEILGLLREEVPNVDLSVVDAQIDGFWSDEARDIVASHDPDLVIGFLSCFDIPNDRQYIEFDEFRTMGIITPCTIDPVEANRIYDLDLDYFTSVEVEKTILEAVRELRDHGQIAETPGLYVSTEDGLRSTGPAEWREKDAPMPAFDLAGFPKYVERQRDIGTKPYLLLNTTKGCPFGCEFCLSSISELSAIKSAEQVLSEIERLHELTGYSRYQFIDDEFPIRLSRAKDICKGLIDADFDVEFEAMNRVEFVDDELVSLLDEAGCYQMSFGMETGDKRAQREVNKELDFEHAKSIFDKFRGTDVNTRTFMTMGLPGEGPETLERNKELIRLLDPDMVSCGTICFPAPCTPLYNRLKYEGRLIVEDWSEYKDPSRMLFEHGYYDSLEEIRERRNAFQQWWKRYRSKRELVSNPTPQVAVKSTIDWLETHPQLRRTVKRSTTLTNLYENLYSRVETA